MNKKLNVSLEFSANGQNAMNEISKVSNSLKKLQAEMKFAEHNIGGRSGYKELADDLYKVSAAYKTAINLDTGKLNITKFNQGLRDTNTSLNSVANNFSRMGATGVQAFSQLTKSIYNAEVPIRRTNKMIDDMWISLKNTAKWQLSSSIIHGFMGSLQSAYGYAQDLNASLNNIRIVTGYSVDEMAKFAQEANKAAQALSTTTTAYTDASLLYYQQGLNASEVKERTDITIKMANVTRQSGEEVSNQMTAIWNNFDDGSKSLEYYADVLANLGAITASSTDEIAGGLEKFAAVTETIGLSYEYAASALATITATTRQSEEVVGTALKTIFARIQGLNLGETLEDGVTLNKYSEALAKVGISIYDQQGELKKMDAILDEMGEKWSTLSTAQQTALAQTVAGARQYTQLMSLMNNWDYMQSNVAAARGSTGTLNQQQQIYEESWGAASKRVKASFENLYDTLIDEDVFIGLFNGLSNVIDMFDTFIDRIGGVNNLLMLTGSLVMKIARTKISNELIRLTGPSVERRQQEMKETQAAATQELTAMSERAAKKGDFKTQAAAMTKRQEGQIAAQLNLKAEQLTEAQQELYRSKLQQLELEGDILTNHADQLQASEKELATQRQRLEVLRKQSVIEETGENARTALNTLGNLRTEKDSERRKRQINSINANVNGTISDEDADILTAGPEHEKFLETIEKITVALNENRSAFQSVEEATREFEAVLLKLGDPFADLADDTTDLQRLEQALADIENGSNLVRNAFEKAGGQALSDLVKKIRQMEADGKDTTAEMQKLTAAINDVSEAASKNAISRFSKKTGLDAENEDVQAYLGGVTANVGQKSDYVTQTNNYKKSAEELSEELDKQTPKQQAWQNGMMNIASATMDAVSAFSLLSSTISTLADPDVSGWEKFETLLTTLPMVLMQTMSMWKMLSELKGQDTIKNMLNAASEAVLAKSKKKTAQASKDSAASTASELPPQGADTTSNLVEAKSEDVLRKAKERNGKVPTAPKSGGKASGTIPAGGVKSIGSSLATLGPAIAAIGIGIAAIAGAIAIWDATQDWWNKNAIAAEEAKKAAESAAEGYNLLKTSHDNLVQGFEGYQKEVEGLESLKKGTLEYQEALLSANEAAYELLNNYEGLSYTVNADGLVTIDEDSLKAVQEQQLQSLESLSRAKQYAATEAKQAENIAKRTEFLREDIKTKENGGEDVGLGAGTGTSVGLAAGTAIGGTIAGIKAGTLIGTWAGPIGMAIGAVVGAALGAGIGAIVGAITENSETERETAAIDKLVAAYETEGESVFKDGRLEELLGEENADLAKELRKNEEETRKLVREMAEANELEKVANTQRAQQLYGNTTQGFEGNVKAAIERQQGEALTKLTDNIYENLTKEDAEEGKFKDILAQKLGVAMSEGLYESVEDNKDENRATYIYGEAAGEKAGEVSEEISDAVFRKQFAQYLAELAMAGKTKIEDSEIRALLEEYGKLDETEEYLQKIADNTDEFPSAEEIAQSVSGIGINSLYQDEIYAFLANNIATGGFADSIKLIDSLNRTINDRDSRSWEDSVAGIFGSVENARIVADAKEYGSITELMQGYVNALQTATNNAIENAGKVLLTSTPQKIFDKYKKDFTDVSIDEIPDVAQKIQDAFVMGGEESANAIGKLYTKLGSEADEFNIAIKNIDWDTTNIKDFRNELSKAGVNLSNVDNELLEVIIQLGRFTTQLQKTSNVIYNDLNKISSIKYGEVISEEDWATVPEELQRFYTAAAGGGYRLTDPTGLNEYYASGQGISAYGQGDYFQFKSISDRNYLEKIAFGDPGDSNIYHNTNNRRLQTILDFLNIEEISNQLSDDEKELIASLQQELNGGTDLRKTGDDHTLLSLFTQYYQNFDYDTYIKNAIEENKERQQDAILNHLLATYKLTYEELEKYGTDAAGIAQARFDRSIGTLVSEYESHLDDEGVFEGIDVQSLSIPAWSSLQEAVADVLNIGTNEVTRDYVQNLIDSGLFENLIKSDGNWQQAIEAAKAQAVETATNGIINSIKEISGLPQLAMDQMVALVSNLSSLTDAASVETAANTLYSTLGSVIDGGLDTIIGFFEALGWETYVDDDGKIHIAGLKGIANTFGSDWGWTPPDTGKDSEKDDKEFFDKEESSLKLLDEEAERYHEINNELEVLEDNLDRISKEKDRAYGANKVTLIEQETAALKKQITIQKNYINAIKTYKALDRTKVEKYGFTFNADDDITNYDEVITAEVNTYNAAYNAYIEAKNAAVAIWNASAKDNAADDVYDAAIKAADATYEAAQNRYETFTKELSQYEQSVDLLRAQEQVLEDIKNQIQDLNYEKITYKLELKLNIDDTELRILEREINKFAEDFYSIWEAMALISNKQIPLMTESFNLYDSHVKDLHEKYHTIDPETGKSYISEADYAAGLQETIDAAFNNIEALEELDKQMQAYYGETLSAAQDELGAYTSLMDHSTSVLDHYYNIVKMINGESDYENLNIILQGQADVAKNQIDVAKATYEMYKGQEEYWRSQRDSVAKGSDAWKLYNDYMLQTAQSAAEAEEEMLAATETWAQKMKDIMVNTFEKSKWDVEKSLTRGLGFDQLMSSMDRLSSLSDEYLTKTNQIYEMQTIQNKLQKEIDKTSNVAVKERLKNFKQDTEKLQEKNQLSKYELELHQAKYEVLLAEIALEEAQNAKSTVRLQRDNEGNFGYVYTADVNKVADAEQNLLDARNREYNISLEAANDYAQKIIETQQQMYDDLNTLYEEYAINGRYTEEEYNQIKEQIISEYNEKFKAYSVNYTLALAHDTNVQKEHWTKAYQDIVAKTTAAYNNIVVTEIAAYTQMSHESSILYSDLETDAMTAYGNMINLSAGWKKAVEEDLANSSTAANNWNTDVTGYLNANELATSEWASAIDGHLNTCETAYSDWKTKISDENETIKLLLEDAQGAVDSVTSANTTLRDTVVNTVVPQIGTALSNAATETTTYMSTIRQQVQDTITKYEDLIKKIKEYQLALVTGQDPGPSTGNPPPSTTPNTSTDSNPNPTPGGGSGGNNGGKELDHQGMKDLVHDIMVEGRYGNDPERTQNILANNYSATDRQAAQDIINAIDADATAHHSWATGQNWDATLDKYVSQFGYNTGGYTGSWGPDGRLGVLHQKEIVLNSDDTENFLAAINLVRDITKMIDLEVMRSQMSAMSIAAFGNGFGQGGTLDQNVHIEASFPNVQDHREIEEAINNLINTASQYAYRQ